MEYLSSQIDHTAALSIGFALLSCYGAYQWFKSRSLPPGPMGLPVLGRLPWMNPSQLHLSVEDMKGQYGDIISYRTGSQLMIAFCSYELVKELLENDNYTSRPRMPFIERIVKQCGILLSEGEPWSHQRRLALRSLRDFGFARTRSAEMVGAQLDIIFELLDKSADGTQSLRVLETFMEATNGVIAQLTINRSFAKGDPDFEFLNSSIREFSSSSFLLSLPLLFPSLDLIVRFLPASNAFVRAQLKFHDFIREQIRLREAVMVDDSTEPECLCDVYVQERRRAEQRGDFETYKELQIIRVLFEFFLAGTDTTARTLEWLFVIMSANPSIQERLHCELDQEIGSERRPQMSDKPRLHYACAVIEEGYRFSSLVPLGIFHRAKRESVFHGYRIPEDAILLPCIYSVNHDPRIWAKPEEFHPEHFLDSKGCYTGPGKNIPFLIGRRACAGEGLARMEVFLMFTAIMQRFKVSLAPEFAGKEAEIIKGRMVLAREPGEHRLVFQRR